jgi:CHAT domain-containing protein
MSPRAATALVLLVLAPALRARAGSELTDGDAPLTHAERLARHGERGERALAAGDQRLAARELAIACHHALMAYAPSSEALCARAEALGRAAGVPDAVATVRSSRGALAAWTLDWDRAIALQREALALAVTPGDQPAGDAVRAAHFLLGTIAIERGEFDESLGELELARAQSAAAGDRELEAMSDAFLCRLHLVLGDFPVAEAHCARARATAAAIGSRLQELMAVWQIGNLAEARGRLDEAEAAYRRYVELGEALGGGFLVDVGRINLATVLIQAGRLDEAEPLVARNEALVRDGISPPSYRFGAALVRGELLAARGDLAGAAAAWAIAAGTPLHWLSIRALLARGGALRRLGDLPGAHAVYDEAIRRIEVERSSLSSEDRRASYLALHALVYAELVGLLWDEQGAAGAEKALATAEAGRARVLLDALHAASGRDTPPRVLSLAALRALLADDEAVVLYVSTPARLFGLVVTRETLRFTPLPGAGDAAALAARVRFYRQLVREVDDPTQLDEAGLALHADLLAPLLDGLPAGGALVVSPDGPLHALPFDALRVPGGAFLVERRAIALAPSASALAGRPAGAPDRAALLAVADPPDDAALGALPGARAEAEVARASVGGDRRVLVAGAASEAEVKAALGRGVAVLHFATHAVVDDAVPLRSALVLAPGGGEDGRLRAEEIYRLPLDAELVVLSGCSTGHGEVRAGEGPMSLARAFLRAGAGAVVATQWDVEDRGASAVIGGFYRRLAGGAPVAEALAASQRELIRAGAPPRAWAPFVVVGPPRARVNVPPAPRPRPQALRWALPGILAILATYALVRAARAAR